MKKIGLLLSAIVMLLASSCADKDAYTVNGKVAMTDFNGKQVYLQELSLDGQGFNAIDTTVIENGAFVFTGKATAKPSILFVSIADASLRPTPFILEAGKIELNIDSVTTVKGTPMNDKFQEFNNKSNEITLKLTAIGEQYQKAAAEGLMTPELEEKISTEHEAVRKELATHIFDYTKANISNPVGEFLFLTTGSAFEVEQTKELLAAVSPEFKKNEQVQELEKHFLTLENVAIGKPFVDVKGKSIKGEDLALSDYAGKGKVVLIDFWASWCGPCIKEMPNVIEAYKQYKSKGFEIVGISLDQDAAAWEKSTKDLGITWPQMSDLKGWQSELSAPYAVRSIPHTILLDQEGKIIAKDLRGEALAAKLAELLK